MKDLGVVYAVRKKNKKMAKGGFVKGEPMPEQVANDSKSVSMNSSKKPLMQADWTDSPTVAQAQKPSKVPLSKPKIMGSDSFSVRYRDEVDQEFQEPDGDKKQPPEVMNEMGADKEGPELHDMQKQHNNKMKPYAEGGMIDEDEHYSSIAAAIMAKKARQKMLESGSMDENDAVKMAEGGEVDIDENEIEQPNMYYKRNQAILKENFDSDMDGISEPQDSNLKGDSEEMDEENLLDRVSRIRAKMQRQFKK